MSQKYFPSFLKKTVCRHVLLRLASILKFARAKTMTGKANGATAATLDFPAARARIRHTPKVALIVGENAAAAAAFIKARASMICREIFVRSTAFAGQRLNAPERA